MNPPNPDESIYNEPDRQTGQKKFREDPSEEKARNTLEWPSSPPSGTFDPQGSVFDEPNILPDRQNMLFDQDWSCSQCGYNLRGLRSGNPCPECGHIELYAPAPGESDSFGPWLDARMDNTSSATSVLAVIACIVLGGIGSVFATFLGHFRTGFTGWGTILLAIAWAPAMEEVLKASASLYIVEKRPYLFKTATHVQVAAIGTAIIFAVIENLIYFFAYIPNASTGIILWRWTACIAIHVTCTAIVAIGLTRTWIWAVREHRPPRLSLFIPWLIGGIILHGAYNAGVVGFEVMWGSIR